MPNLNTPPRKKPDTVKEAIEQGDLVTANTIKTPKKPRTAKQLTEKVSIDQSKAVTLVSQDAQASQPLEQARGLSVLPVLELIPQLLVFDDRAEELEAMEKRAVIDSADAYQRGSDFEAICKQNFDQLEALRKTVKGPVDDYAKLIQSVFVPKQTRFNTIKQLMNTKRLTFHKAEEKRLADIAAAQQKANEEEMLRLAQETEAKGDAAGASAILEAATQVSVAVPAPRIGGANSFGQSSTLRKRWVAEVKEPFVVLGAIIRGEIPISVLEWKPAELNAIATKVKVEGVHNGLKIFQAEGLSQR